jgi:hypothetical protein
VAESEGGRVVGGKGAEEGHAEKVRRRRSKRPGWMHMSKLGDWLRPQSSASDARSRGA